MNFKISKFVKFIILFFQIISIAVSACMFSVIYFWLKDYKEISLEYGISHTTFFLLLCFISYISIKSIIVGIYIFWFIVSKEDIEIIKNRHILIAFSITIGGITSPLILTLLPNITITTINDQKIRLSKMYTPIYLFCGMGTFIISSLSFTKPFNPIFENDNSKTQVFTIIMIISLLFIILGFLNFYNFYFKNKDNNIEEINRFSWILIYINQVFLTINLIFTIILSILNFLSAVFDFIYKTTDDNYRSNSVKMIITLFRIMNLVMIAYYTWWIVKLSINSIKIIWSKEDKITIYAYEKFDENGVFIRKPKIKSNFKDINN